MLKHYINVLSPKEYERQKTQEQQAEDIAYTINLSLIHI